MRVFLIMVNPIPTLSVVSYKGSGNVTVHKLLNGTTLDPLQDGNDVGGGSPPGLEVPSATDVNGHANRLIEAFGKRFLLHGFRVYERDQGGSGNWGEVTGLGLSATDIAHSGLHLLHPAGVPTLAFLRGETAVNTVMSVIFTTDGATWTEITTPLSILAVSEINHSIVYNDSIFWWADSNDGIEVRSYDFALGNALEHNVPELTIDNSSTFHVHQGELFVAGINNQGTDNAGLWRLDGTTFTPIDFGGDDPRNLGSSFGMWSDGNDLILCFQTTLPTKNAWRVSNVLFGESFSVTDINTILTNCASTAMASYIPFVSLDPDPSPAEQRVYFWQRTGDYNGGTFNLFRFNYRVITTDTHTGAFALGEIVTGGTSGAIGLVTDIVVGMSLSMTNVTGTFQSSEVLAGNIVGVTNSTSTLADVPATALGTGIAGNNFGLPQVTDGGLDRIPTATSVRPAVDGLPVEITGSKTKLFFRVYGTGIPTIILEAFISPVSEAPDMLLTLVGGTLIVESGAPATTPTISGNQIINITADSGVALYSFQADLTAAGITSGQNYTLILDIVV